MSFQLEPGESPGHAIARIARKQMDKTLEDLNGCLQARRDDIVHEARKGFKKIRSVLRLVRPHLGEKFQKENTCFRDAGRPLTEVRDAQVLVETLDKLIEDVPDRDAFDPVRKGLLASQKAVKQRVLDEGDAFGKIAAKVRGARTRIKSWTDLPDAWAALGPGFQRVYGQARRAFQLAASEPTSGTLHEWRKQTKYFRHQLEILGPLWPTLLSALASEAERLGELLGDDHDLVVLSEAMTDNPKWLTDDDARDLLMGLIDRRRAHLQREATFLGQRLFGDRPEDLARRLKSYWKTWRSQESAKQSASP